MLAAGLLSPLLPIDPSRTSGSAPRLVLLFIMVRPSRYAGSMTVWRRVCPLLVAVFLLGITFQPAPAPPYLSQYLPWSALVLRCVILRTNPSLAACLRPPYEALSFQRRRESNRRFRTLLSGATFVRRLCPSRSSPQMASFFPYRQLANPMDVLPPRSGTLSFKPERF